MRSSPTLIWEIFSAFVDAFDHGDDEPRITVSHADVVKAFITANPQYASYKRHVSDRRCRGGNYQLIESRWRAVNKPR